jgi:hypothetical protein
MSSALFCTSSAFFCTFSASCFGSGGEITMDVNRLPQNRYVVVGRLGASARHAVDVQKTRVDAGSARDGQTVAAAGWLARQTRLRARLFLHVLARPGITSIFRAVGRRHRRGK